MPGPHPSSLSPQRRWDGWLLGLLVLPFLGIWAAPLFDLDEGAFTAATLEMFLRGDFLTIELMGAPRTDKPILSYWLQAASVAAFGFHEWGWRLPSALAAAVWIGLTYAFVARVLDRERARLAALIIACAVGPAMIQRAATADALLNLWLAAAGYAAWLWLKEGRALWHYAGHAAMALGFLTKGPVAVVVPATAVLLWCLSRREPARFLRWALAPGPLALSAALALPWFVAVSLRDGGTFVAGFLFKHNVGRFGGAMEGHGGPLWYYLPVLILSLLPFSGLLPALAARLRGLWRDELMRYGLIWFALVFALFSLSGTKLPHYLYYGYGGLVLALAQVGVEVRSRGLLFLPGVLLALILLTLPELLGQVLPRLKPDDQALLADYPAAFGAVYRAWFAAALLLGLILLAQPRRGWMPGLYAQAVVLVLGFALLTLPAAGWLQQGPVREAGRLAARLDGPLVLHGVNVPSFQTYAGRVVSRRPPRPGDLVLTRTSRLPEINGAELLWRSRGYALVRVRG